MGTQPLRWRRQRYRYSSDIYELWRGNKHFATVAQLKTGGWYWYNGQHSNFTHNTAIEPVDTLERAKLQAAKHVRAALKQEPKT